MKLFEDGAEIRLTRKDILLLIQDALNKNMRSSCEPTRHVTAVTLHKDTKYVIRAKFKTEFNK